MDNITKLRYWTFKILPLVYDESLSYYEVLCKVTAKINELVDSNNAMPQAITDEITKQLNDSYAININNKINSAVNTATENANNQIDKLANEVYAKLITAIATDEGTNTFTKDAKNGGELIFLNGTLYKVTAVMPAGTNYIIGTNIIPVDISEELKTIKETYISTNNEHWNERSTNNYNAGIYLFWKDILYITTKDIHTNDILYADSDNQNLKQVTLASEITNIQKQIYKNDNDISNLQKNLAQETSRATNRENFIDGRISNIVAQSGNDNTEIVDARIGYDGTTYDTLGTAIRSQASNLNEDLAHKSDIGFVRKNLVNIYGKNGFVNYQGIQPENGYYYSDPIYVYSGDTIYTSYAQAQNRQAFGWDISTDTVTKDRMQNVNSDTTYNEYHCTKSGYYRFNFDSNIKGTVCRNLNDLTDSSVGIYLPTDDIINKNRLNKLYGKKLSVTGDSIMYGAGYKGGFAKIIADRYNMILQNIAVSGGTIASGTTYESGKGNRFWICNSISSLESDADYILFDGCINDFSLGVTLGSYNLNNYTPTLDTTKFIEAFESCCKQLRERFYNKKIGYIFTHRVFLPERGFNVWKDHMINILNKWGIPYLDLENETAPLNMIQFYKTNFTKDSDGWHPTKYGYQLFYVDKVISFMENM